MNNDQTQQTRIALIGLGYVGLPLAVAFARHVPTVGFDINAERIAALRNGRDVTGEISAAELADCRLLQLTDSLDAIRACNVYIVTVPTPVDDAQRPDLRPLQSASRSVGSVLKPGDLVIYESTVYPGTTEEVCVPLLEQVSGLSFNTDFHCGYSPERINPGDKINRLETIVKITSGSTPEAADRVDALYRMIVRAGTWPAGSIRVAEAAKVIENTQRDVNIALMNELAMIFERMGIDTHQVLAAAGSKWNFLRFTPGLVGGHCIGVDPYYLTHKATTLGYHPELTLAARRINDKMSIFVANQVLRLLARRRINAVDARILVLGLTFKENCPDLRNTKVVDLVKELSAANAVVEVYDPWVDPQEALHEYGLALSTPGPGRYAAVIIAVAHREFVALGGAGIRAFCQPGGVIFDIKGMLPLAQVDARL